MTSVARLERERQLRAFDVRLASAWRDVVAVEADVEPADRRTDALVLLDRRSASRSASGTPRVWMPTRARPSTPPCFSTISWLMRIKRPTHVVGGHDLAGASRPERLARTPAPGVRSGTDLFLPGRLDAQAADAVAAPRPDAQLAVDVVV